MKITLVVAIADSGVIGREGGLPWRLSSDLKRFKADTMGKPIVMGRKTYESVGRALPGRLNIVVTRDPAWRAEGVETAASLDEALALADARCAAVTDEICVIGGGEIFNEALPRAGRLRVTHVLGDVEGDVFFPEAIDPATWQAVHAEDFPAGQKDSHATRYVVYERRAERAGADLE
jgi:dihydrofolate reductase